jgi:hypothetical protein
LSDEKKALGNKAERINKNVWGTNDVRGIFYKNK